MEELLSPKQHELFLEVERNPEVFCLLQNCLKQAMEKEKASQVRVNVSEITNDCMDIYNKLRKELVSKNINIQDEYNLPESKHTDSHRITNELDTVNKGVKKEGFYIITTDYRTEEKRRINDISDNLSDIKTILNIVTEEIREKGISNVQNIETFRYKLIA